MISLTQGNLLDADAEALVNTVNTKGIMGKGIALMFKDRFPANFDAYADACKRNEVRIGEMFVTKNEEPSDRRGSSTSPPRQTGE
jgi:O-acetyl-ADP-ribose deacetylase (regulator of RNase III)